ncbi:sulfolipid-1 biosynthesis phthioceranic/hydroxyphthioceranic acid synthase [Mycobacterium ulcerans]|uniref:Phthioceranic/hydroxyphthioceranic acid synthase n=1 Tax=Mycobacterium ulcerans (strain Agy99) TaxID=362242 RepID=A0PQ30_MYCUA|nr:type I polyketide synthase [Mycobacterium ulcerans]ABL04449.1 multifunctional mycocerosic acid synthase membrane-associated Mas [Mycobacterium ulcerans Agy99]MEB3903432.1 sulfolipid-1 biosynthesis phthioceranic/hydroxyphthioceranic acid synthase [Mycobacterium ulcerans]MEB3907572.1 sulfolipid-1 biosynthesis phthioceranic/hydroxyphthioceranic acid synthase [Mycobacterium ulcerans]MEB3917867.1 sulfolipid-1 biosynthesis phthioceranic/hydroxyphthioceranic acid synthase [Mycobacterium ulcerans]M
MQKSATPVAIIGMGCRLPGGVDSPEKLWESLLRGDDLVSEIPPDRWDVDDYYDPEPGVPGRTVSRWGGFIDDVAGFDAEFFGVSEREATSIDPQHRQLLETAWEAIEHAGLDPASLSGSSTGVFVGLSHEDYLVRSVLAGDLAGPYASTGLINSVASGRIAHTLGLHGPAMTVDTACSSGLLTVHLACRSLHEGESDLALAGGCALLLEPNGSVSLSSQGMLSPTGRCHAFDVDADGFVRSEGCAVVVLKRLSDALADGDRILAVVRGTAANQDGRSETLLMPSETAQVAVYREALAAAGVDAASVGAVEVHGTGTPVGDPIEYRSLAQVYGSGGSRCMLGSVKTNIGHSESAAGTVGLIKATLSLGHGVVPPMVHHTRLPDELAEIETGLYVPHEITPWPEDQGPRRIAVSSFGMSGTNVHAILEEPPTPAPARDQASAEPGMASPLLFALSSTSADGLRQTARELAEWVGSRADSADSTEAVDLAYTLARRRAHRPVRTAVVAASLPELVEGLQEVAEGDLVYEAAVGRGDRGPVWVFSGQGSQWAAMGADLLANEPVFAATVAAVEPIIAHESGFSVTEAMTAPEKVTGIDKVQPTLFAMQVALAATMEKTYGVRPGAVIGHSLGEAAAAVVAGSLSLEDGARVISRRSKLMLRISGAGAMASVELPAKQVNSELMARGIDDVAVAVVASPQSTVVGGATDTVRDLVARWEQREVMAREVAVDVASHSPQVDPILEDLATALADIVPSDPKVPYYSATLFDPRERPTCDAAYWVDNLRNTVQFAAAVQAALEDGFRVFAELSPHPLLTHAVDQNARSLDMSAAVLAGMRREQPLPHGLRGLLTDVHSAGAAVDFSVLYPAGRLVNAPPPAWTHRRFFVDGEGQDSKAQGACSVTVHPLLGAHVRLSEQPERHVWQTDVGTDTLSWLSDHQVRNVAALPGAAYCEMALAAAGEVFGEAFEVRDLAFEQMLLLDEETPIDAVASLDSPGAANFVVQTHVDGETTRHATAALRASDDESVPPAYDIAALLAAHPVSVNGAELREAFVERGIQHGPAFSGLAIARTAETEGGTVLAEVALPASIRFQQGAYGVHPALLDACFQSVAAGVKSTGGGGLLLPLGVRSLRAYGPTRNAQYCYTRVTKADANGGEADLELLDEQGCVLLAVRGLRLGTGTSESGERDRVLSERLLTLEWQQRQLPEVLDEETGSWLLISASDGEDLMATTLADALKSQGAECASMVWSAQDDLAGGIEKLGAQLRARTNKGVVIVCGPRSGDADEQSLLQGREQVRHLVRITRGLAELEGELPRLFVVTRQAQRVRPEDEINLEQAGLRGLLRVIGSEHPLLQTTQVDVDESTQAEQLAQQLLGGSEEDETAWRGGEWYVARLFPGPLSADERQTTVVDHERDNMRLQIRTPGDLQTLELAACDRVPPGPGQIEVAVTMSSINFADVLIAFGRYPSLEGRLPETGTDFVGVVTAVGEGVTDHQVGDRVGGFSKDGCWRSYLTCDANLAVTLPAGLSDEHAAASSTAHATAWYGLNDLAGIKAGDRVLIHSATGGVGQAAIAIARAAGAQIFATAGNAERRQLVNDMGIEHVYDSRSIEFADQIRRDTNGYGVDIVLNSLTGAAQRAGLELLAFGGRFVEIGKADVYGNTRMGLYPFRRGLTFYYVDLGLMSVIQPERVRELLSTVYNLTAEGVLSAPECTHYPLAEAAEAIRTMSNAAHTGKLLLDMPRSGRRGVVVPPEQVEVFRGDGSYIITGGLGGLGLFFASKMAAAGCGRIVLTARSQPNPKSRQAIERLRANGADIVVECGNIAEPETADRLVSAATATGLPLRGVLHAAAVVEDATLSNITDELIDRDWSPKVYGSWNLHRASTGQPLDWFCLFSSGAALMGSPGQGAYAAANSWVDAFAHWRRAQGLPVCAIGWGAWGEVGRATFLAEGGEIMIAPDEGMYAFEQMLRHARTYTGYIPIIGAPWLADLVRRSPWAEMFQSSGQNTRGPSKFLAELKLLPQEEWAGRLRRLIAEQASVILRRTVDADRPFVEYGLDSLGMLEMRTHIETETGVRLSPKVIASHNTARALSQHLADTLAEEEAQPAAS